MHYAQISLIKSSKPKRPETSCRAIHCEYVYFLCACLFRQVERKALFFCGRKRWRGSDLMSDTSFFSVRKPRLILWQFQVTKMGCSTKGSRISGAQESLGEPRWVHVNLSKFTDFGKAKESPYNSLQKTRTPLLRFVHDRWLSPLHFVYDRCLPPEVTNSQHTVGDLG